MQKQPACCGRFQGRVIQEEAALAKLARQAARYAHARPEHWQSLIARQKASVAEAKRNLVDHEASHTAEAAEDQDHYYAADLDA